MMLMALLVMTWGVAEFTKVMGENGSGTGLFSALRKQSKEGKGDQRHFSLDLLPPTTVEALNFRLSPKQLH